MAEDAFNELSVILFEDAEKLQIGDDTTPLPTTLAHEGLLVLIVMVGGKEMVILPAPEIGLVMFIVKV